MNASTHITHLTHTPATLENWPSWAPRPVTFRPFEAQPPDGDDELPPRAELHEPAADPGGAAAAGRSSALAT